MEHSDCIVYSLFIIHLAFNWIFNNKLQLRYSIITDSLLLFQMSHYWWTKCFFYIPIVVKAALNMIAIGKNFFWWWFCPQRLWCFAKWTSTACTICILSFNFSHNVKVWTRHTKIWWSVISQRLWILSCIEKIVCQWIWTSHGWRWNDKTFIWG